MNPFSLFSISSFLVATTAFAQVNLPLIAHWPMDGNVTDASSNGYHGKITGNTFPIKDRFNYSCALAFSQPSSHIEIGSISLDSTKGVSFSFWSYGKVDISKGYISYLAINAIQFDTLKCNNCSKLILEQTFPDEYNPNYPPNPLCSLWLNSDRSRGIASFPDCKMDQWNHIAFTFTPPSTNGNSSLTIYKNNVALRTIPANFPVRMKNVSLSTANKEWNGAKDYIYGLDDFRIYNGVFTSNDVNTLFTLPATCVITGTTETEASSTPKPVIIAAYDLLGRSIENLSNHTGPIIYLHSDGSRNKAVLSSTY